MYDNVENFREYLKDTNYYDSGVQHIYKFPNNYGISNQNRLQLCKRMTFKNLQCMISLLTKQEEITYHTPITQDVIGHLAWKNVEEILQEIKEL